MLIFVDSNRFFDIGKESCYSFITRSNKLTGFLILSYVSSKNNMSYNQRNIKKVVNVLHFVLLYLLKFGNRFFTIFVKQLLHWKKMNGRCESIGFS